MMVVTVTRLDTDLQAYELSNAVEKTYLLK